MNDILMSIFTSYVVPILGSAIMALGTYGITLINNKIKNEQIKSALEQLTKTTISVVQALNQTFVYTLRDDNGRLSDTNKKTIKDKAIFMVKANMPPTSLEVLDKSGIDVDKLIYTEIEAQVYNEKVVAG